ncbi:reverse transcriptase domain-containing protein [Tanacetum coccineum]
MAPKRTPTSAAPTMSQAAIKKLVADSISVTLETQAATMANAKNTNRNIRQIETPVARKCSYKEFMSCQPFNFKVLCPTMVPNSKKLMEVFIGGLPRSIEGNVTTSKPQTLEEASTLTQRLMDQVIKHNFMQGTNDHKRKFNDRRTFTNKNNYQNNRNNNNNRNNYHQQQHNRRQETVRAYAATLTKNSRYTRSLPLCKKCTLHHTGPCSVKCQTCNKVGHQTRNCRNKGPATGSNLQPVSVTCHACGEKGHYRTQCPKANNSAYGRAYLLRDKNTHQDLNVVTGTFFLNQYLARVLFDSRADKSFISTSLASMLNIPRITLDNTYEIEMADGNLVGTNTVIQGCTLILLNQPFEIDLMPLKIGSFNVTIEDSVGKPLYSRFIKTNDFKGVPHPLSGDYTPKPQEKLLSLTNINSVRSRVNTVTTNANNVRSRLPIPTRTSNIFSPKRPQNVNAKSPQGDPSCKGRVLKRELISLLCADHPLKNMVDRGIFDSGCSGHMTGNKDQLEDFEEFRFSWVFFLASKDETSGILQNFIRQIENQLSHRVKIIRSDNGTEFKNRDMLEFCGNKGIKQEYSNARTPQQNGVAERMNRTLIEAARTMLADSLLPTTFWAEAVSTACYIFNRVRVTKPQNKTPYELLFGHKPIISYIRPFGCHVTILDTLSMLGKFDGKSDEGFLVGYSLNSKAYRVYTLVTKRVEVNMHVNFLEDKPNVKGVGYRWMFDIDHLTDSMNYIPVSLENQANPHAGTSEVSNSAGTSQTQNSNASEEKDEDVELIVVPSAIKNTEEKIESRTSSTNS